MIDAPSFDRLDAVLKAKARARMALATEHRAQRQGKAILTARREKANVAATARQFVLVYVRPSTCPLS